MVHLEGEGAGFDQLVWIEMFIPLRDEQGHIQAFSL